jgi:mRNA interferase YafQ
MPSTPPPGGKRAPLRRQSYHEKGFVKDWQRLTRSGRYNMNNLKEAMLLLIANTGPLPTEWSGYRECHVGGDFLLIYRLDDDKIVFVRAGTHAELFE